MDNIDSDISDDENITEIIEEPKYVSLNSLYNEMPKKGKNGNSGYNFGFLWH